MTDLPTNFNTPVTGATPIVDLMEAIGVGPDSEQKVTSVSLLASDQHSGVDDPLPINRDGSPVYSCERWLRLRFSPPFGAIQSGSFWVSGYTPNPGWVVLWGSSVDYHQPTAHRSQWTWQTLPTAQPSTPNLVGALEIGSALVYSDWLVIQASLVDGVPGVIQPSPFTLHFGWAQL